MALNQYFKRFVYLAKFEHSIWVTLISQVLTVEAVAENAKVTVAVSVDPDPIS